MRAHSPRNSAPLRRALDDEKEKGRQAGGGAPEEEQTAPPATDDGRAPHSTREGTPALSSAVVGCKRPLFL